MNQLFKLLSLVVLVLPACLYANVTQPLSYRANTTGDAGEAAKATDKVVKGESCNHMILGLVAFGDGGYDAAVKDALKSAPGAKSLYDVKTDDSFLNAVLGIYIERCTLVEGRVLQ
ncbi:MAG: hypothetical protein IPJ88_10500 [Myxococcales bacterium]|nr:MAG: hypothetical protein IPJ88_10500 [Myxococcales bacterium]